MPLTGEAKKEYQRVYMRGMSKKTQDLAVAIQQAVGLKRGRPRQLSQDLQDSTQAALALLYRSKGLTVERLVEKNVELLDAVKVHTVAGEATKSPDNDAQARALESGKDLLKGIGLIPTAAPDAPTTSGGVCVRMVQIDPDGTERVLEIG